MKTNLNAIVFAIAIIIASIVLGNAYVKRTKITGTITVTGLGKQDFTSDLIVWEGTFSKENQDLKIASSELEKDKKAIGDYLIKHGINKNEIVFSAISIQKKSKQKYSNDGRIIGEEFDGYNLTQSIQIQSKEVEKVENISRNITDLLNEGIQFYSTSPNYYYTKLSDLKIELISKATENARTKAEKISEKSGRGKDIGGLISAQMGIFQITGQNSDEAYSSEGTFNTSSKAKTASVTMRLIYKIN